MSANLDLVRSIYADWERGDFSSSEWAEPDIEYVVVGGLEPGTWTGLTDMAQRVRYHLGAWKDVRLEADEYREVDDDRVLVFNHRRGRGTRSGLEVGRLTGVEAHVFHIRNGKVRKIVVYVDRDRALADLGLASEETALTPAEKLALAQRSYAAFSAGPDIEALLPLYHLECEWRMGSWGAAVGGESFRGHDGLRAWVALLDEAWENSAVEIDEARITGEGVLLLRGHSHARSRGTHMELSMPRFWQRGTYSDGRIFSVEQFDEPPPEWDEATPIT